MARILALILFGLVGAAVLSGFGVWQLQRMQWKSAILQQIDARLADAPVAVPPSPDPARDGYLAVTAEGRFTGQDLRVLASTAETGPGVRVIALFETPDGRRLMVDRGFLPDAERSRSLPPANVRVTGTLHWPDEADGYTPPPDPATGLLYARDVPAMAAALQAEPVLIVARLPTGDAVQPMPVDSSAIPNNHWGYAIQWFLMALAWLAMTGYALWRIRRRKA